MRMLGVGGGGLVTVALLSIACVQTDVERLGRELPCALAPSAASPADAVVALRAPVEHTLLTICSGVALSPRLIATQLKCVLGRSTPAETEAPSEPAPMLPVEALDIRTGSTNFAAQCRPEANWAPLEDGDFSARLGDRLDPRVISVARTWTPPDVPGVGATEVYVADASSLCGDDLALVALEEELDVPRVAIRFGETSAGQELVTSGFCDIGDTLERREFESQTESVTTTAATPEAPPRSLTASGALASTAAGGAAIAADTGAIIGLIMSGTLISPDCWQQAGSTLITALAPYRRLLLDVAAEEGETLYSERQPSVNVRSCSSE